MKLLTLIVKYLTNIFNQFSRILRLSFGFFKAGSQGDINEFPLLLGKGSLPMVRVNSEISELSEIYNGLKIKAERLMRADS